MLVILTALLAYLIDAILVGFGVAVVLTARRQERLGLLGIAALFVVCAFLDSYFIPALSHLDATLTIANVELLSSLGMQRETPLSELFEVEFTDSRVWGAQVIVALVVGQRTRPRSEFAAA